MRRVTYDLSRAGSPVIDIDTDVRTTHITFVTDYGQQCHSSKILLVRSRRRRGHDFLRSGSVRRR
jgi:hypothetical protein